MTPMPLPRGGTRTVPGQKPGKFPQNRRILKKIRRNLTAQTGLARVWRPLLLIGTYSKVRAGRAERLPGLPAPPSGVG